MSAKVDAMDVVGIAASAETLDEVCCNLLFECSTVSECLRLALL